MLPALLPARRQTALQAKEPIEKRFEEVTKMASVFRMAPAPAKALWSVARTHGYSRLLSLEAPGAFLRALDETRPR